MRQWVVTLAVASVILGFGSGSARAWNDTGHETAALIAWDNLSEQTRQKIVELMQQAPPEADLVSLFAQDNRPSRRPGARVLQAREHMARPRAEHDATRSPRVPPSDVALP